MLDISIALMTANECGSSAGKKKPATRAGFYRFA
jgi:hypothetical protein